jgi:hypothetical protein
MSGPIADADPEDQERQKEISGPSICAAMPGYEILSQNNIDTRRQNDQAELMKQGKQ